MNQSILETIAHTEGVLAALRQLAAEPAAQPFRFSGTHLQTGMLQFFPPGRRGDDHTDIARPFALLLGGQWTQDADQWESNTITYPGLTGVKVVLHYIEPVRQSEVVQLEPARDEPDYDTPRPLTPLENHLQNDEHNVR